MEENTEDIRYQNNEWIKGFIEGRHEGFSSCVRTLSLILFCTYASYLIFSRLAKGE